MNTAASGWGWLDGSGEAPTAAVLALPAPPRPAPTLLVTGAAGGAGASVLSVLLADISASTGVRTVWIDAAAHTGDAATRITATDDSLRCSVSGAELAATSTTVLRDVIDQAPRGAAVVIDAGVVGDPSHWPAELSPVVVIAARPDTANRSKTVLATLAGTGHLEQTTVVVACLDPWAAERVGRGLAQALSPRVGRVVLWDYDPHLGTGGPIEPHRLSPSTIGALSAFASTENAQALS